ncbi:MAG TPA: hypothetical protein VKT25_05585 [Ktedonobacteraceae bacterium]|nr:hypothetical protein [Ktedonobacteraceae bacterium]
MRKTREALEAELAQYESQLDLVFFEQLTHESQDAAEPAQAHSLASNPILSALLACLPAALNEPPRANTEYTSPPLHGRESPLSPAIADWNGPLPEEMSGYLEAQFASDMYTMTTMTDPQLELPWWLRKITEQQPGTESNSGIIDPGSARTNRLVQRWIDRWGRQAPFKEEDEGRSHAS